MAKLTKAQAKAHQQACDLLDQDALSEDDVEFILANWREDASHVNTTAGAFFTPPSLASDFALEVGGPRIIDLCAGIGTLARACWNRQAWDRHNGEPPLDIVCIEANPDYVAVGRKIAPFATWICASIFNLPDGLGRFDYAISNPPFGRIKRDGDGPTYTGSEFEYHVIDIAASIADQGAFILPQFSAGFTYSGNDGPFEFTPSTKYASFVKSTGIELGPGIGIDTSYDGYEKWNGVAPKTEVACADFSELCRTSEYASETLFGLESAA